MNDLDAISILAVGNMILWQWAMYAYFGNEEEDE